MGGGGLAGPVVPNPHLVACPPTHPPCSFLLNFYSSGIININNIITTSGTLFPSQCENVAGAGVGPAHPTRAQLTSVHVGPTNLCPCGPN